MYYNVNSDIKQLKIIMKKYDLVIQNGTIVDGKRTPRFKGDIGIVDGMIETIGKVETGNAKQVINAEGKIVAPGFVDLHTHFFFI